jgi:antibiotic biosynthesis monooxygenase (ABM) superfamily enzyme
VTAPTTPEGPVIRVARRRARPGCEPAYEALVGGMLQDTAKVPGFLSAEIIPPGTDGAEHQTILHFASADALAAWDRSPQRREWHRRLNAVADGDPDYQVLSGLEAWFARPELPGTRQPPRWKMALVTWIGIYLVVMLLQVALAPWIGGWNFFLRNAVFTGCVVLLATWVLMPQLVRVFRPWLTRR